MRPETIGRPAGNIPVELSSRFLEHFSEHMYSSPQKAFEELISNGWDAGADCVDVRVAPDLGREDATLSILDNGHSMDGEGLRKLWHVAFSPKAGTPLEHGRRVVGKFGVGKLATYVLATRLTYICKAADGLIRRVTMDYGRFGGEGDAGRERLVNDISLDLFEASESEVAEALASVHDGHVLLDLIARGVPRPPAAAAEDEFRADPSSFRRPTPGTWTLAILSGLKPAGREIKVGILRRMLAAALPFGSEMAIVLNGEALVPSKTDAPVMREWVIGPELGIDHVDVGGDPEAPSLGTTSPGNDGVGRARRIPVSRRAGGLPGVELSGIGVVTGSVRLFKERVSGGKSDELGASNGFHVNVLGRVVNQRDPAFGESNLSHAAWARFRMAVRADGLNALLTTDREKLRQGPELEVFRAFLRRAFNVARVHYDSDPGAGMPDGGDPLVRSLGVLSLNPLRNVVSDALAGQATIPGLLDDTGVADREERRRSWREDTADNIRSALAQVRFEHAGGEGLARFRIADNTIVVDRDHPFVVEHWGSRAEKELLRTLAMVNLLSDFYALDIGVQPAALESVRGYRDRLLRFRAMQRRQSGVHIAGLLLRTQHDSANSKLLEAVVSDALRYLGFQVRDLAKSGEPEGIASAYSTPTYAEPTGDDPTPPLYSFSFDAKSSKHDAAATGNVKLDGVVEHRERYRANHALVVAPGFRGRALAKRCGQQRVTPMTARDLGRLLEYTVTYGAISLVKMREVFQLHDPVAVSGWVEGLGEWLRGSRPLTMAVFLKALENLKGQVPDVLPAATIALECRRNFGAASVRNEDVLAVARGLSILLPDLVGVDGDKIVVNASAARVAAAIDSQMEALRDDARASSEGAQSS